MRDVDTSECESPLMACPCEIRNEILIVDDNIFNILTLETILQQKFNKTCDRALNGQEAFEKVRERFNQNQ